MDERMNLWLEQELKEYASVLREFQQKVTRMMYLWMLLSVAGMTALGFFVGGSPAQVFSLHFPVGCVIALVIWVCFWFQNKVSSMKKVRASYEKAIAGFFRTEEDKSAFLRQMENNDYGKIDFMNTVTDKYPCRFIVGPDYFMFSRDLACLFIRAADIKSISAEVQNSRVRYRIGDTRVMQNLAMGVSLILEYKEDSASAKERLTDSLYLENDRQYTEAAELIQKYCSDKF